MRDTTGKKSDHPKILFGTTNQTKRDRTRDVFAPLDLTILSLADVGIEASVEEDCATAEGNARKKAVAYCRLSGLPSFSIDYGLTVDKFPSDKQPGTHVRRIWGDEREATDEELVSWFIEELKKVGGKSEGVWHCAIAIALSPDDVRSAEYTTGTLFTDRRSPVSMPREPLNSIQWVVAQGKYKSERTPEEWVAANNEVDVAMMEFMKKATSLLNHSKNYD